MVTLRSQEILCLSVNVFKNIKIKWGFEFYTHSEDAQTQSDTSLDELTLKTFYETELRMFRAFNLPFPIKKKNISEMWGLSKHGNFIWAFYAILHASILPHIVEIPPTIRFPSTVKKS